MGKMRGNEGVGVRRAGKGREKGAEGGCTLMRPPSWLSVRPAAATRSVNSATPIGGAPERWSGRRCTEMVEWFRV